MNYLSRDVLTSSARILSVVPQKLTTSTWTKKYDIYIICVALKIAAENSTTEELSTTLHQEMGRISWSSSGCVGAARSVMHSFLLVTKFRRIPGACSEDIRLYFASWTMWALMYIYSRVFTFKVSTRIVQFVIGTVRTVTIWLVYTQSILCLKHLLRWVTTIT
jgi:hypothetical protein